MQLKCTKNVLKYSILINYTSNPWYTNQVFSSEQQKVAGENILDSVVSSLGVWSILTIKR